MINTPIEIISYYLARENSLLILVLVAYFSVYLTFLDSLKKRRAKRKEKFHKALIGGLKIDPTMSISEVINIYKSATNLRSEDLNYRYSLSKQLRELLVEIVSKGVSDSPNDEAIQKRLKWKQKISEFIKQNEEISPYADLPAAERNILSDLSVFLKKNDIESAKRKILELGGMIQARHDDLNKIRNINKWTVPLSIMGLILTLAFGYLALVK